MSVFTTAVASFAIVSFAITAAAPAAAATPGDAVSVEVRHGDLDLTRLHDVTRLNRRIRFAAEAACGNYDPRNFPQAAGVMACRNEAVAAAIPKVELAVARAAAGDKRAGALAANTIAVR